MFATRRDFIQGLGLSAAALAAGVPAAEGLCIASKASAIAVTRPGAAPSIPDRDEVAAFR